MESVTNLTVTALDQSPLHLAWRAVHEATENDDAGADFATWANLIVKVDEEVQDCRFRCPSVRRSLTTYPGFYWRDSARLRCIFK
jgi:hypothetical protein